MMIDELNQAIGEYQKKWAALVAGRKHKTLFEKLKPTAVAWKTEDLADFDQRFAKLREYADHIHIGRINERWIATMHLQDTKLAQGIAVVKLMQRRPGSTDATGLDHLDFYAPQIDKKMLEQEADIKWTDEHNGYCDWLSVWFAGTEAKLRHESVLDVCIQELEACQSAVLAAAVV